MKPGRAFQCMIVPGKKAYIVILKCGYLSVCQRVDVPGLPIVWCEIIGGWDCDKSYVTLYIMARRQPMHL